MSWTLARQAPAIEVEPGQMFRTIHANHTVETARVHGLWKDTQGIPHVHYSVEYSRSQSAPVREGPRALSLDAFARRYTDVVAA